MITKAMNLQEKTKKIMFLMAVLFPVAMASSMGLMEIFNVLWLCVGVFYLILRRKELNFKEEIKGFFSSPLLLVLVLFVLWGAFATSIQKNLSSGLLNHLGPLRIFGVYFLSYYTFREVKAIYLIQKILFIVASLGFINAILQHVLGRDLVKPSTSLHINDFGLGFRAQGFFNNPITFANSYLPFLLLAFASLLFLWKRYFFKERLFLVVFLILGFIGIYFSLCRYLLYTIPFVFLLLTFMKSRKLGLLFLVILTVAVSIFLSKNPDYLKKLKGISDLQYSSNANRLKLFRANYELIKDNFWLGIGINNEDRVTPYLKKLYGNKFQPGHAHNHFIQIFSELGLPGFILFIIFNSLFLFYSIKGFSYANVMAIKAQFAAAIAIIFAFHLGGLTQNTFGDSEVLYGFFYLMGLAMMLYKSKDRAEQGETTPYANQ